MSIPPPPARISGIKPPARRMLGLPKDCICGKLNFGMLETGATGVYLGKLVAPEKPIADCAEDHEHIDEEAPKVIKYLYASEGHDFMINKVLDPEQGITHDVFKEKEPVAVEDDIPDDEQEQKPPKKEEDILESFDHVFVCFVLEHLKY